MDEPQIRPVEMPQVLAGYLWKVAAGLYLVSSIALFWKGHCETIVIGSIVVVGTVVTTYLYIQGGNLASGYFKSSVNYISKSVNELGFDNLHILAKTKDPPVMGGFVIVSAFHGHEHNLERRFNRLLLVYYSEMSKLGKKAYLVDSTAFLYAVAFLLTAGALGVIPPYGPLMMPISTEPSMLFLKALMWNIVIGCALTGFAMRFVSELNWCSAMDVLEDS